MILFLSYDMSHARKVLFTPAPIPETVNYDGMIYHSEGSIEVYEKKKTTARAKSQGEVNS